MLAIIAAAILVLVLLLLKKRIDFEFRTEGLGLSGELRWMLLRLIPVPVRFRLFFEPGRGILLRLGGGEARMLGAKKRKRRIKPLRFITFSELSAEGSIGFESSPDKSVLAAGSVRELFSMLFCVLSPQKGGVHIAPELSASAFDLKMEGIVFISPVKLLKEITTARSKQ